MRFNRQPISVIEAKKRIEPFMKEGETESVALLEGDGRRLAEDVRATHPIPHFRRSSMDGFAVRSEDFTSGTAVQLFVQEEIPAGKIPTKKVSPGTCSRIMTGAAVPEGADAVVKLEDAEMVRKDQASYIRVNQPVYQSQNVTDIGEEVSKHMPLLEKGRRIGAGEMALLATFGYPHVKVYKKPKVAILSTGSELLKPEDALQPGKIRNSNSYMLAVQVKNVGGQVVILDQVPDQAELAKDKIMNALSRVDMVITTGGVSVGDFDILVDIFEGWEGELLFNKLKMRPGSPTSVGVWKGKLLFALSGNPGACFAGFELFTCPVLWRMQGKHQDLTEFEAVLSEDFTNHGSFPRYVRGHHFFENGKVYVKPVGQDKSSVVTSIADADVLIQIPSGPISLKIGDVLSVLKLNVYE